jgi:hypothetical protein
VEGQHPLKSIAARLPGLPGVAWAAVGMAAALPAVVRLQVVLQRFPLADWLVWSVGMVGGALLGIVALVWGLRLPWRWSARRLLPVCLVLTAVLAVGGLWHFPRHNLKDASVATEWHRLHPTLRWGVWAVRLVDRGLVVTDISRQRSDYVEMDLPVLTASKHYLQWDGYAHAVDLRLRDAGPWRRWFRQGLFLVMGLRAERHQGSAEHLHIYLP